MERTIPLLESERLRLRPFALADSPTVRELAGAPEVAATTLLIPHPYPEGGAEAWIGSHPAQAAEGTAYVWAVERSEDGALLGAITLHVVDAHERGELGYWLGVPYWGQGYMTEAARRVVAWGFGALELHRVGASCLPRNLASSRVMEKAGMRYEGTRRGYARRRGVFEDVAFYGMLQSEHIP